jgi:hypothetical protein
MNDAVSREILDDAGIIGGSPIDRVIGMLLERTEAMRELHESMRGSMREELHQMSATHADIKITLSRIMERQDNHEKNDLAAFATVHSSNARIDVKLDNLGQMIGAATTASVIQKAQFDAGWKVIVVVGGLVAAAFAIFAIFFNHRW